MDGGGGGGAGAVYNRSFNTLEHCIQYHRIITVGAGGAAGNAMVDQCMVEQEWIGWNHHHILEQILTLVVVVVVVVDNTGWWKWMEPGGFLDLVVVLRDGNLEGGSGGGTGSSPQGILVEVVGYNRYGGSLLLDAGGGGGGGAGGNAKSPQNSRWPVEWWWNCIPQHLEILISSVGDPGGHMVAELDMITWWILGCWWWWWWWWIILLEATPGVEWWRWWRWITWWKAVVLLVVVWYRMSSTNTNGWKTPDLVVVVEEGGPGQLTSRWWCVVLVSLLSHIPLDK